MRTLYVRYVQSRTLTAIVTNQPNLLCKPIDIVNKMSNILLHKCDIISKVNVCIPWEYPHLCVEKWLATHNEKLFSSSIVILFLIRLGGAHGSAELCSDYLLYILL